MVWGRGLGVGLLSSACLAPPSPALATHAEPLRGQWHVDVVDDADNTPESSGHDIFSFVGGGTQVVPGRFGNAFVASTDIGGRGTVLVPGNPGIELLEPAAVTLLAWVKNDGYPGIARYVAGKGGEDCTASSYALYTGTAGNEGLSFYVFDGAQVHLSPNAGTSLYDGNWHLVAGTYDGSAVRLYVDGQQVGSGTPASGNIAYALDNRGFAAGEYPNSDGCFETRFPGPTDEVRVYSRALSQTEIGGLAAAAGSDPPVLVPDGPGGGGGGGGSTAPPTAAFAVSLKSPTLKRAAWMNGVTSTAAEGLSIKKYEWDFNSDGRFDADCGEEAPAVSHTFKRVGVYEVTLRVTDPIGQTAITKQQVAITNQNLNRARHAVSTCEEPLGGNQADTPGCVKSFQFSIIDVNGRGGPDQCFKVEAYAPFVRLSQIKEKLTDIRFYRATIRGPVALNGLPVPLPNDPSLRGTSEYDSGRGTISLGKVPILVPIPGSSPLKVADVPLEGEIKPVKGRVKLPPLKGSLPKIKALGGLKLGGGIEVHLLHRAAEVFVSLKLPDVFSFGFKREAEGRVVLRTTNVGGFEFEGLRISQIPQVFLGPLYVTNLFFDYRQTGEIWRGGANFQLAAISPVEIKASPPPPDYGFGLRGGSFDYAGGGVSFPYPPRPQLFPGVGLVEIGGAIGVNPVRFTGRMAIDVGGFIVVDGSAFVGLASEDQPYDFPEEYAPPGLGFLAGRTLDTVSIAIGGEAKIRVPIVGEVPLINSYVFYAYPDYAEFGGGFKFNLADRFSVDGNVGGFASVLQGKFNLEGQVRGCADIEITKFCLGVSAVVSSKGIGFCTIVPLPISPFGPTIPVPAGIGHAWGGGIDIKVFSCDTGPYKEARPAVRGAQAGGSFTLEKGLPSAMVKVVGTGAPPNVVLTGPKGERILAPQDDQAAVREDAVVIPQTPESTTLIALKQPSAGRWTVTAREGSAPIASVAAANGLADPNVKASVRGSARRRVLRYRIKAAQGQTVTFFEHGARTHRSLGASRRARGRIAFSPAPGRRERREIVAEIERGGVIVKSLVVAHFRAPRSARPPRPSGLRVRRRRGGLAISWRRARGAFRYGVTVQLSNRQRIFRATRKRRVLIGGIHRRARGTVLVGGLRADGVGGREARRRFR